MESNYHVETESKGYLHDWLGQRRSTPIYDTTDTSDQFGFFNVTVISKLAPSLLGAGRARSKKDAQRLAALMYCEQLVKNGFMTAMPGTTQPISNTSSDRTCVEDEGDWDLKNANDHLDELFKANAITVNNKYTPIGVDGKRCIIAEMWFTVQGPERALTKMYAREEADTKRTADAKVSLNAIGQLRGMNLIGSYIDEETMPPSKKMCTLTHSDRPTQTRIIEQRRMAHPPVSHPPIDRVHQSYRYGFMNQDGNIAGGTSTDYEYSNYGHVNYGGSNSTSRDQPIYPQGVTIARPPPLQPLVPPSHSIQAQRTAPHDPRTAALNNKRGHPN